MSFYWILLVTVVFYLELTKGQNSEELYVVKHPDSNELTCASDDDDAALVWNYALSPRKPFGRFNNFEPVKPIKDVLIYNFCAIWRLRRCLIEWYKTKDWKSVSVLQNPMAPIVDYRWEGFKEYVIDDDIPEPVTWLNSDDGTAIFSFRGTDNIQIHLCYGKAFHTSGCIVIKLAIDGKYSAIESCQPGNLQCHEEVRTNDHKYPILDAYEWRTFRLQWISSTKMVKVFRDTNENAFLQTELREWQFIQSIWVSSTALAGIRLHGYYYMLAEKANAEKTSAKFRLRDTNFCAKMLVSLCPDCHLIVALIDSNTGQTLTKQNIYGNLNYYSKGLRTWRSVKVTLPLKHLHEVQLQLKTGLRNDYNEDVWWAFDDIRLCDRNDGVRKSTIAVLLRDPIGFGSEIKCQKLFSSKIVVADASKGLPSDDISWLSKYVRRLTEACSSCGRTSNIADFDHTSSSSPSKNIIIKETEAPSLPENLEVASQRRGIVKLKWSYPLFAPRKMVRFHIEAHRLNTNPAINSCTETSTIDNVIAKTDKQSFSMKLVVQTSTEYQLHLKTVDYCNRTAMTAPRPVSISEGFIFFTENQLLSNFKEAVIELEVPAVANATKNTRVVVTVNGVSSCEPNELEDLSPPNDWTKPLMERVIAEFPIRSRKPVNSTFDTNEYYGVEKICNFQHPQHYWIVITLKDSALDNLFNFISFDLDPTSEDKLSIKVWLAMIPVLVISLLILCIWYWRRKKIPGQINHSPDVPLEPPYLIPRNWRVNTSCEENNSTISDNSREQSSDAQDIPFPPLYASIPDDPEEQTNFSQDVPSTSKVQTSYAQTVPSSPLYVDITYDLKEQTSHGQKIPVAPLYVNTSDNSTEQSNHAQDHPYEPLYLKIIDD